MCHKLAGSASAKPLKRPTRKDRSFERSRSGKNMEENAGISTEPVLLLRRFFVVQANQSLAQRIEGCLGAVGNVELGQDAVGV